MPLLLGRVLDLLRLGLPLLRRLGLLLCGLRALLLLRLSLLGRPLGRLRLGLVLLRGLRLLWCSLCRWRLPLLRLLRGLSTLRRFRLPLLFRRALGLLRWGRPLLSRLRALLRLRLPLLSRLGPLRFLVLLFFRRLALTARRVLRRQRTNRPDN